MKKFVADPSFWALFPGAAIGVLAVEGVNEAARLSPEQSAEVEALLKSANAAALAGLDQGAALSQYRPVAVWRAARISFPSARRSPILPGPGSWPTMTPPARYAAAGTGGTAGVPP